MTALESNQLHLYYLQAVPAQKHLDFFASLLSQSEHEKIIKYKQHQMRNMSTIARGALRFILASYLRTSPREVSFDYNANGKPLLSEKYSETIHFNIAHSEECLVLGFTRDSELGIDVEKIIDLTDSEAIARNYFTPEEREDLQKVPKGERLRAFYNCWTRKEAILKAIGKGLSQPLNTFRVSLIPGEPCELLGASSSHEACNGWKLLHLTPFPEYVGAVATKSRSLDILEWRFESVSAFLEYVRAR